MTVFSLQPGIWEAPRDDVYLRFNMSLQQVAASVTEFTVCARVFPTALTTLQVQISYATGDDTANILAMCKSAVSNGGDASSLVILIIFVIASFVGL